MTLLLQKYIDYICIYAHTLYVRWLLAHEATMSSTTDLLYLFVNLANRRLWGERKRYLMEKSQSFKSWHLWNVIWTWYLHCIDPQKNTTLVIISSQWPPFVKQVQECKFKKNSIGSSCSSYHDIPKGNELDLQEAVAKEGPVAVGVDAKSTYFRFYSHGVFDYPECKSSTLNHGMLVVGYGSKDKVDYWLVKNR